MSYQYEHRQRDHSAQPWHHSEKPPGSWHDNTHRRRGRRERTRSPLRHRQPDRRPPAHEHPSYHDTIRTARDPRRLIAELGPRAFSDFDFTLECIRLLQLTGFTTIWQKSPPNITESQRVAYGVPPGIRVDIDNISDDKERKSMQRAPELNIPRRP